MVFSEDHGNISITETNLFLSFRKTSRISSDDDVSFLLLYDYLQPHKGSSILPLLEKQEREKERKGREGGREKRTGKDGRGGQRGGSRESRRRGRGKKEKKKGEGEREGKKRKIEQLYSKLHNKETKSRGCQFFFLQVENKVGFCRRSMNTFCVI